MVDTTHQVPAPSASAWLIELKEPGRPIFIVHRLDEAEAREALAHHLAGIGAFIHTIDAERAVNAAAARSVGVVW
jgi:hypothetical protein